MRSDKDREIKARLVRDCDSIDLIAKQSSPSSSSHEVESPGDSTVCCPGGLTTTKLL